MLAQYIDHSAFYLETDERAYLFDYFRGDLPDVPAGKPLLVLASHAHPDHYTPEIFARFAARPGTFFVLSDDICPPAGAQATLLGAHETCTIAGARIGTLRSTDAGVAFLIGDGEKTILHMGDLNWWDWGAEDTPEEKEQMARSYCGEIARLREMRIDLAFVPLDPRLGANFHRGADYLMRTADVRALMPMHTWGDETMGDRLARHECSAPWRERILHRPAPGGAIWL